MCGIAGTTKKATDREIERALKSMSLRGPDGPGSFVDERVTLLHARLSIIDLNARSNQPMHDAEDEVSLVFNGEIFNYQSLRSQFSSQYKFKTTSDTEVVLAGYKLHGNEIWGMLSGMFAAAVYDRTRNKLVLARDHTGIKPLFYTTQNGVLSWSSELKTLFQFDTSRAAVDSIDQDRLADYFVLGYVPSPHTIYSEVYSVEKSTYLEYSLEHRTCTVSLYQPITYGAGNSLAEILTLSITEHLVADVPVSLFFSGGMDSSILASVLHAIGHETQAFTLLMPGRTEDHEFSKKISSYLGMKNEYAVFDQSAFDTSYDAAMKYSDVPLGDLAIFPTHYVSALASKSYRVVLSGEGGDELFYGYPRHLVLQYNRTSGLRTLLEWYLAGPRHKGKGKVFSKGAEMLDAASYYIATCSPSLTTLGVAEFHRMRDKMATTADARNIDRDWYVENMLLRKLDTMTMANSIEGRVPLLSPRLFEYSARMPREILHSPSDLKKQLRNELARFLPIELIERKKTGFGFRPDVFVAQNAQVRADFHDAYEFLQRFTIPLTQFSEEWLFVEKPGLVLACTILYRSITNHKKL
jgi:asparagine synthase (glutamine-hydrolysing)